MFGAHVLPRGGAARFRGCQLQERVEAAANDEVVQRGECVGQVFAVKGSMNWSWRSARNTNRFNRFVPGILFVSLCCQIGLRPPSTRVATLIETDGILLPQRGLIGGSGSSEQPEEGAGSARAGPSPF